MKRVFCAACVSLIGWQALAGEADDYLKKLEAALQKAPKEQKSAEEQGRAKEQKPVPLDVFERVLPLLRRDIDANNLCDASQTLSRVNLAYLPDDISKAITDLSASLYQAMLTPIKDALKHAAEAVNKAKTAAELDPVLKELASPSLPPLKRDAFGGELREKYSELEYTYAFVASWQEYLAAKAAGYDDKAREIARKLADAPMRMLPRSELLAKAYERKSPEPESSRVRRPIATPSEEAAKPSQVVIGIDQSGMVSVGNAAPVAVEEVDAAIASLKAANPDLSVIIRTHREARYQKVVDVMDALKRAGVTNIAFVTAAKTSSDAAGTPAPKPSPAMTPQ